MLTKLPNALVAKPEKKLSAAHVSHVLGAAWEGPSSFSPQYLFAVTISQVAGGEQSLDRTSERIKGLSEVRKKRAARLESLILGAFSCLYNLNEIEHCPSHKKMRSECRALSATLTELEALVNDRTSAPLSYGDYLQFERDAASLQRSVTQGLSEIGRTIHSLTEELSAKSRGPGAQSSALVDQCLKALSGIAEACDELPKLLTPRFVTDSSYQPKRGDVLSLLEGSASILDIQGDAENPILHLVIADHFGKATERDCRLQALERCVVDRGRQAIMRPAEHEDLWLNGNSTGALGCHLERKKDGKVEHGEVIGFDRGLMVLWNSNDPNVQLDRLQLMLETEDLVRTKRRQAAGLDELLEKSGSPLATRKETCATARRAPDSRTLLSFNELVRRSSSGILLHVLGEGAEPDAASLSSAHGFLRTPQGKRLLRSTAQALPGAREISFDFEQPLQLGELALQYGVQPVLLVHGGLECERPFIERALQNGWQVIFVKGSGGLAEEYSSRFNAAALAGAQNAANRNAGTQPPPKVRVVQNTPGKIYRALASLAKEHRARLLEPVCEKIQPEASNEFMRLFQRCRSSYEQMALDELGTISDSLTVRYSNQEQFWPAFQELARGLRESSRRWSAFQTALLKLDVKIGYIPFDEPETDRRESIVSGFKRELQSAVFGLDVQEQAALLEAWREVETAHEKLGMLISCRSGETLEGLSGVFEKRTCTRDLLEMSALMERQRLEFRSPAAALSGITYGDLSPRALRERLAEGAELMTLRNSAGEISAFILDYSPYATDFNKPGLSKLYGAPGRVSYGIWAVVPPEAGREDPNAYLKLVNRLLLKQALYDSTFLAGRVHPSNLHALAVHLGRGGFALNSSADEQVSDLKFVSAFFDTSALFADEQPKDLRNLEHAVERAWQVYCYQLAGRNSGAVADEGPAIEKCDELLRLIEARLNAWEGYEQSRTTPNETSRDALLGRFAQPALCLRPHDREAVLDVITVPGQETIDYDTLRQVLTIALAPVNALLRDRAALQEWRKRLSGAPPPLSGILPPGVALPASSEEQITRRHAALSPRCKQYLRDKVLGFCALGFLASQRVDDQRHGQYVIGLDLEQRKRPFDYLLGNPRDEERVRAATRGLPEEEVQHFREIDQIVDAANTLVQYRKMNKEYAAQLMALLRLYLTGERPT